MVKVSITEVQIKVEMLGDFSIAFDGAQITKRVKRSSKIWKLLQYLITFRGKSIPQEELIDVFCGSDVVGNPGSALRTMVYRARSALAESGVRYAEEMILSKDGGYSWNNAPQCTVDAEEFESLWKKAGVCVDDDERLELLLKAIELYKGDFLPNSAGEMWVMPLSRWYRSIYIECVHAALELLTNTGHAAKAEELSTRALQLDPFDEVILEFHLRSLLTQGKFAEANDEYKRAENMFYDVLGISFSDNLRELLSQIKRPVVKENISLEALMDEWLDGADFPGAYYCEPSEFKTLFRIETRSVPRSGRTAYLVRIDTKPEINAKNGGVMGRLGMLIPSVLRMGDLFTRASPSQYLLMLHSLTYENCKDLINRILYSLDTKHLTKVIATTIKAVKPLMDF